MAGDRFVVLGLARARAAWFAAVAQWATSAAAPIEFVKCVSTAEVRAHLATGRAVSALLLDDALPSVDRDLIAAARDAGSAVLIVAGTSGARRDWATLGAAAVLPADLSRNDLVGALSECCTMVGDAPAAHDDIIALPAQLGRAIAVTGPGGTGASTAAIALAQQLAFESAPGSVVLADFALHADQAVLNDVRDIVPGVQELVEAHRGRHPTPEEVRALTFSIEPRGYSLLLGLRRARYWSSVPPRAFEAAFASLRHAYAAVVCDVSGDVEGEQQAGSVDVEERNVMARTAVFAADAVVVVGAPRLKGVHSLVRLLRELIDVGVTPSRIVPVVNRAPRAPRERAEITATVAQLISGTPGADALQSPVFLPRKRVDPALLDLAPLPSPLGAVLAGAVDAVVARHPRRPSATGAEPQPVAPGSLGTWTEQAG